MPSAYPGCTECPLHEGVKTVCIAPSVPSDLKFAVVGEAPGQQEDEEGQFFVGRSGQLLWDELGIYGLQRDNAFVTNTTKCRPPGNRNPKVSEMKKCRFHLDAELDWLRQQGCKYVLALGTPANKSLGGTEGVTSCLGVTREWEGFTVFPCLHPAATLHNPGTKRSFKEAIKAFSTLVHGKSPELPEVHVRPVYTQGDFDIMMRDLSKSRVIAYDIEGVGLDEQNPQAKIHCISLCGHDDRAYVVVLKEHLKHDFLLTALQELFKQNKKWVAHHGKFDNRWMRQFAIKPPKQTHDTILMAHLLDENMSKNVEAVAAQYLGLPSWGQGIKPYFEQVGASLKSGEAVPEIPTNALMPYAAMDVVVERQLALTMWPKMDKSARRLHNLLLRVSNVLGRVEQIGTYMDNDEMVEMLALCEFEMAEAKRRFVEVTETENTEINLGSTQQVQKVLYKEMGLPVGHETDGGAPATDELTLKKIRRYAPKAIQCILDYRKYAKWKGSYLEPWQRKLNAEGRLRSNYNIVGTVTGRVSCTNVKTHPKEKPGMSLHQVPRDGEIRSVISAAPGRTLIVADYSQIELRVAADIAKEDRMILNYIQGGDIHALTASTITGKAPGDVTKKERTDAKAVNFGFLYGMWPKKFVQHALKEFDIEFSIEQATQYRNTFFSLYPGLSRWHKEVEDFVSRYGFVVSPIGRVRRLPEAHSDDRYLANEAVRKGINAPVQDTASIFTLAAMVLIDDYLRKEDVPARIIGQVHDSIMIESNGDEDEIASTVQAIMEKDCRDFISKEFGYRMKVPLQAEVEIGKKWSKPEKVLD